MTIHKRFKLEAENAYSITLCRIQVLLFAQHDREVLIHTPEFAAAAASEAGHNGLLDAAKAMAMTVADILQPGTIDRIRQEFRRG
jgi:hypothetical protein